MRRRWAAPIASLLLFIAGFGAPLHALEDGSERVAAAIERIHRDAEAARTLGAAALVGAGLLVGTGGTALALASGTEEDLWNPSFIQQFTFGLSWASAGVLMIPGAVLLTEPSPYETALGGEKVLQELAHRAETDRWLRVGILSLVSFGLLNVSTQDSLPWTRLRLFPGTRAAPSWAIPLEYPFATAAALACGAALIQALVPSVPEAEYRGFLSSRSAVEHFADGVGAEAVAVGEGVDGMPLGF